MEIAIPRRLLRKHVESLSKSAVIKVPSAATWKLELLKHKDEVSFTKEVGDPWNNSDAAESNQEDKLEDHEDDDDDDDASVEFIDISSCSQETGKATKGKEKLEYEGDHGGRPAKKRCHPSGTPLSAARDSPGFYFTWTAKCTTKSAIKRKEE
ncbi:hypothetical protein POTOM_028077 [Populus tomentosa]|uniref:Uncharacterized protein n=1 Tax=Populus tomentosa TaxID=118781 RepID=A0A8X7ZPF8_POPTO|nr:hypothetical protein POTOM_028077 [Populus tomentosa]